ncbi:kelch domain-containing protein 10-like [Diadema setosum]|uniref:kelch domain-containing protein 10-like n=1 Tax=Diadema setosum TaxID=31175 RepID=UPI003B3BE5EC
MDHLYPLKIGSAVVLEPVACPESDRGYRRARQRKPCARSGHCAVADETNVYLFGGYNPDEETVFQYFGDIREPLFGEVWRYHIPSNQWHLLADECRSHFKLASMSAVRRGRTVLIYGGTSFPFGHTSSNQITWLDVRSIEWHHRSAEGEKKPINSYGQTIAILDPYLYVFGGTTGWVYCSDVHRCHLHTSKWERVFDLQVHETKVVKGLTERNRGVPDPRYRHEMLSDGRRLYVIGGGTSQMAFTLEQLNVFDTETRQWELMDTYPDAIHGFPGPRRCHGCAQLDNVGYITGGYDGERIYDDIWTLSLDTRKWTKLTAKLPQPVYFHASAITPSGCLFIHGGVLDKEGRRRTKSLVRVWVRMQPLLQLAWSCVRSLLKDPSTVRKDTLQAMGVPPCLLPDIG